MARFASLTVYILHPINIDQTECYSDTVEGKQNNRTSGLLQSCDNFHSTPHSLRSVIVCCKLRDGNIVGADLMIERTQHAGSATQLNFDASELVAVLGPADISMYIV